MLRGDLQSSGHVARDELARILLVHEVIPDTRADKSVLHIRQFIDGLEDVNDGPEILIEVLADIGLQATGAGTLLAERLILTRDTVHVRRRTTEVGDDPMPVRQSGN